MFIEKKKSKINNLQKNNKKNVINETIERDWLNKKKIDENSNYTEKTINDNNEKSILNKNSVFKF